ncbi:MAG: alpha/beta hydrolase [Sneathiellaceae bacterium]
MTAREVEIDGATAFLAQSGPAPAQDRPALVLLHGAGGDHTAWFQVARAIAADGGTVLVPDLPGNGRSGGSMPASVPALAQWLWSLLDAVGAGPVVLAGHSLGSLVALEAAGQKPERVAGLGLLATALPMAVSDDLLATAERDPPAAGAMMTKWAHGSGIRAGGSAVPGLWSTVLDFTVIAATRGGALHAALKACADYPEAQGLAAAARVAAPALLLLGAEDRMTPPRAARRLLSAIAGAELRTIPDCGHMMMVEQPAAVRAALRALLAAARAQDAA